MLLEWSLKTAGSYKCSRCFKLFQEEQHVLFEQVAHKDFISYNMIVLHDYQDSITLKENSGIYQPSPYFCDF